MDRIDMLDGKCDEHCKAANHCNGHWFCERCGNAVCSCELIDGICPDCMAYIDDHTCECCGEVFVELDRDGFCDECGKINFPEITIVFE